MIKPSEDCVGCFACYSACPQKAISMIEDEEGFLVPSINQNKCSNCGICEVACPLNHKNQAKKPLAVYAAKHSNEETKLLSSSGGMFSAFAEKIIAENGVVFGAKFNEDMEVVHNFTETIEGLADFRGSKYVQSKIGDTYLKAKEFLDSGRKVLFTGTPCQIAGLKSFLQKDYENLLTIDLICHGVPSPLVWRKYLSEIVSKSRVVSVSFRDKSKGWHQFSLCVKAEKGKILYNEDHHKDPYMQLFLRNVILRPSCYKCNFRCGKSGSDITIADFWGIQEILPEYHDNKGVSLVLINTERGRGLLNVEVFKSKEVIHDDVIRFNKAWYQSYTIPEKRDWFFSKLKKKSVHKLYRDVYESEYLLKNIIKGKILALYGRIKKMK